MHCPFGRAPFPPPASLLPRCWVFSAAAFCLICEIAICWLAVWLNSSRPGPSETPPHSDPLCIRRITAVKLQWQCNRLLPGHSYFGVKIYKLCSLPSLCLLINCNCIHNFCKLFINTVHLFLNGCQFSSLDSYIGLVIFLYTNCTTN